MVVLFGERIQKLDAISFIEYTGIQDGDDALVIFLPDQATDALPEFNQGIWQCKLDKGALALFFYPVALCFGNRVGGILEGKAGNDYL